MKFLTEEQVFNLKLNVQSQIWTTGFIVLNMEEKYKTPFGILTCVPGEGWVFEYFKIPNGIPGYHKEYPLKLFLEKNNISYSFSCPILAKLQRRRTSGLIFKLFGFPYNSKCWI